MKNIDPNATPSTDRTADAIAALKGGGELPSVESAVDTEEESEISQQDPLNSLFGEGSDTDDQVGSGEDTSRPNQQGADKATKKAADVEEIIVRGPNGSKKKISVDFNNREQILQNAKMAAGARKWQAERDRALSELESVKGYKEKADHFNVLSEAYDTEGPLGVLKAMLGPDGAKQWLESQYQKYEYRQSASPEELKLLESQEQAERQARELEVLKRRQQEWEQKMASEKEAAEIASLQSTINPVFDKYRFAGKLGNPSQEHDLDEVIWTRAIKDLKQYEEQGLAITREIAEKAFRKASAGLRNVVEGQADKKAERKISQTKQRALETAQVRASRGFKDSEESGKAREMLSKGDISGFFKSFGNRIKF